MRKSSIGLIELSSFYMMAWPLTPFLRGAIQWRVLFIVALIICLGKYISQTRTMPSVFSKSICFILVLWLFNFLILPYEQYYVKSIAISMLAISTILYDWSRIPGYRVSMKLPLNFLLVLLTLWNISSFFVYLAVPGLTRSMTAGTVEDLHDFDYLVSNPLLLDFCLDFSQLYAQLLIFPLMFFALRSQEHYLNKKLCLAYLISVVCLIINSGFSTANICLLVCVIGCLLHKTRSVGVFITSVLIIFAIGYICKSFIGNYLLDNVTDDFYRWKLEYFFSESHNSNYNFDRVDLWLRSLNSFFEYPLGGGSDIGGHSGILDFFGGYGIILGICFIWLLYSVPSRLYFRSNESSKKNILLTYIGVFSICVIFNPVQISYGIPSLGILPILLNSNK